MSKKKFQFLYLNKHVGSGCATVTLEQFFDAHYALLSGRLYLKFEQVDIEELLRAIKPDNLNLEIPKEIPKIWGDSRRLARAFEVFFQRQC